METKTAAWQKRFNLTTCAAAEFAQAIPENALGVAVISTPGAEGEKILLVIESRTSSLLSQFTKRLQTGKLPPVETLTVAYHGAVPASASAEALHEICRQQVILATQLRRELRPAMR